MASRHASRRPPSATRPTSPPPSAVPRWRGPICRACAGIRALPVCG
ncbi:hypothetical protein HU200_061235 [Digitaria exilis]|uniref:Uncharacterized protein n=1 Tax=Digitaria exilis TaxID=1010633 RepID=A0A835E1H5_9POAL|nr:hypothetical protein HU200_061235 [Digitaria exilis]